MNKTNGTSYFAVFAALLLFLGFSGRALAGLSVSPGMIEMIAARGDEASGSCKVTNTGKEKTHVTVEPEDWKKGADGKRGGSVSDWLTVKPKFLDLDPGKTGEFLYRVRVGPDAAGENTAQIFFSEAAGGETTQIHTRVGVILYVAVRDSIRLDSEIVDFKMSAARDQDSSLVNAQVSVANKGNVHIRPTGQVELYDKKGGFMLAAILATGWGILPGETYAYQGTGKGPALKLGKYKAVAIIQYGKLFKQDKSYRKELFLEIGADGKVVSPR